MAIDLSEILGYFSLPDSPLRDLPELAAPVLLALSPVIHNSIWILEKHDKQTRKHTVLPCLLKENLREYFRLTLFSRLNKIVVYSTYHENTMENKYANTYDLAHKTNSELDPTMADFKIGEKYGQYNIACSIILKGSGYLYNEKVSNIIREYTNYKEPDYTVITDKLADENLYIYDEGGSGCTLEYFYYVRARIETEFASAYKIADMQCRKSKTYITKKYNGNYGFEC